jgi:hypothetical protein
VIQSKSAFLFFLVFCVFSEIATHANDLVRNKNTKLKLTDVISSPDWVCNYSQKANLAHSADGSVAATVMTISKVTCIGQNAEKGTYIPFETTCLSPSRDVLPNLKDCVESAKNDSSKFVWAFGEVTKTAKRVGPDKYGRKCIYNTLDKKARIAYRLFADGKYDAVCATPLDCDNFNKGPKHWIVACKADQTRRADGEMDEFCPQPADCVDNELPLTEPHAAIDLASYSKSISAAQNETVISAKKKTH